MRRSSDPQLSPSAGDSPPEHPAHTSHSAHSSPAHHPGYQSHSSETAGSYCDLRPCPAGPPKPPAKSYVERLRVEEGRQDGVREEGEGTFSAPQVETTSSFRPSRYEKHANTHYYILQNCTWWCFQRTLYLSVDLMWNTLWEELITQQQHSESRISYHCFPLQEYD